MKGAGIVLQTTDANLGRFMQSFLTSFTVSYNRRHRTSGHVFQGRYKAFLVEDESDHGAEVSRYIHLNPARIPSDPKFPGGKAYDCCSRTKRLKIGTGGTLEDAQAKLRNNSQNMVEDVGLDGFVMGPHLVG